MTPIFRSNARLCKRARQAGGALPPRPVLDAVTSHLAREDAIGCGEAAAEAEGRIAGCLRRRRHLD